MHLQQVFHEIVSAKCYILQVDATHAGKEITILDTLFSVRILFLMIAVGFDCTPSKSSVILFQVNVILCSRMLLMLGRKYTLLDALFSGRIYILDDTVRI